MSKGIRIRTISSAVAVALASALLGCTPEDPSTQPVTPPESEPNQGSAPPPPGNEPTVRTDPASAGGAAGQGFVAAADAAPATAAGEASRARAQMSPTEGSEVAGTVEISESADAIVLDVMLTGLTPGRHGFHVHEYGDCSAPDASSAGDHYNPSGTAHGAPDSGAGARHAGDLGNVEADASGVVEARIEDSLLEMEGERGVVGHAIIVHSGEDDLASQPSGESGDPLACGVVRAVSGDEPGQSRATDATDSRTRPGRIGG